MHCFLQAVFIFGIVSFSQAQNNSTSASGTVITDYGSNVTVLGTQCGDRARSILAFYPRNITLLDKDGRPTDNGTSSNLPWGISYSDCKRVCGSGFQAFDFSNFQLQFTSWLLPFLALTAQLPYGASSRWKNMLTCIYAVGSPMLLIYDLTMTVFYRLWVKNEFEPLLKREDVVPAHFRKRARAAKYILQNCHHVPIKITQGEYGCLSSAVVLKENTLWWQQVQYSTKQRRRPLTQSLGAQIFWVAVTQIFVWIASLQKPGDKFIGLGLSSGLVLLWMLPVVWGTYEVGNFPISNSINEAIAAGEGGFYLAGNTATEPQKPSQHEPKTAIAQRELGEPFGQPITDRIALSIMNGVLHTEQPVGPPGPEHLADQPQPDPTADQLDLEQPSDQPDSEQSKEGYAQYFWWFCVQGDEIETGVTMNYARLHTSRVTAMYVIDAFKAAMENLKIGLNPDKTMSPMSTPKEILALEEDRRFWGTRAQVAEYCGLNIQPGSLPVFRNSFRPGELPPSVAASIAALIAMSVIWGALGAGILIAYQTPTTGLGCYSGSILIYGMLSTLSFFLFLLTSQLSRVYCRRLEKNPIKPKKVPILKRLGMLSLRALTVLTRLGAKSIAIISALWEITSTILAYSNIFSNCWCDTVYFSRGISAYTTIFIDTDTISDYSRHIWFGGLFLSLLLCVFVAVFFTISREKEDDTNQTTDL